MGTEVEGRTLAKGRDSLSLVQAGSRAAMGTIGKAGMGLSTGLRQVQQGWV